MSSDQLSNWIVEQPCQCLRQYSFTTSLTWEEVQMVHDHIEKVLTVGRLALNHFTKGFYERLRVKDVTHEAVQVTFKCDLCGHQFRRTYELENFGKSKRGGFYGKRRNVKGHSTERFSFKHVEECFAQMSEEYHLLSRNCGHWAREFYAKVVGHGNHDEEYCSSNQHGIHPNPPELGASNSVQCPICEEDFHYKVQRDHHLKMCRKDVHKLRTIQTGRAPVDINMINRWLWDKPPTEPFILQQETQQRQQQLRQQQLVLEEQKTAAHNLTSNKQSYQINKQQQQQRLLFPAVGQQQKPGSGGFDPVAAKTMAIRLGKEQPQTAAAFLAASQRQQQMSALGMALATGIGGAGTSRTQGAKQPSVGEILKMAKDRTSTNLKMTPQVLQPVMALQMQKNQQVQQKSQQILAATAAANRSLGYAGISAAAAKLTTGPAAIRQKQQMGTTTSAVPSRGKPAKMASAAPTISAPPQLERQALPQKQQICEICDTQSTDKDQYRIHLQQAHRQLLGKTASDMVQGAPLACSRCRERFWTYEGLERHLVMSHGLVTSDLLAKAQRKQDSGRCKLCGKSYGFTILQHLMTEHQVKLQCGNHVRL